MYEYRTEHCLLNTFDIVLSVSRQIKEIDHKRVWEFFMDGLFVVV